jgi:NAD(P)-dependent dehydrogenase (short-subunit alcohol dehydrogenase family)
LWARICDPIRRYCRYLRSIVSFLFCWPNARVQAAIEKGNMAKNGTAIVAGAQQVIGEGLVEGFLQSGYSVVATSLRAGELSRFSPDLIVIEGDIRDRETATKSVEAALTRFGTIDVLVNNAGIYIAKPFTEFTADDFNALVSVNLLGFLHMRQLAVKQMLQQESGCVVTISASLADNPIAGVNASVSMITKGGLNTITRHLAIEYAKQGIRFNAIAPGVVDTPLHRANPKEYLRTLQPMGSIAEIADIVEAVLYLASARQVTGEVLHVDGGDHGGRW